MIKSKILYSLCIAVLGLSFAEAMDQIPNRSDNGAEKSDRTPYSRFDEQKPVCKVDDNKPTVDSSFVKAFKERLNGSGNGCGSNKIQRYGSENPDLLDNVDNNKQPRQPHNKNENLIKESKKQVRNDGRQNNPNAMRKSPDSAEYRNMNGNPGWSQYNNSSYGKYEGSYCDLMPKLPGVFVNGNLHSGDEIEIIACVLNLVSTDYECTASILNRLAESKLKSLEFLNGKKYSESIIQNITRTVGRQNTYGLLNYTKNGDNKLQMIKGITDGSSLADDIISMKCDFVSKLKEDDIGILKECVNKNSIKINVANKVDIRYETCRIYWPAERKKIKDYLRDLKLSGGTRKKALKVIFYNDFYKIDELSYLTLKEKDAVKNKLL